MENYFYFLNYVRNLFLVVEVPIPILFDTTSKYYNFEELEVR